MHLLLVMSLLQLLLLMARYQAVCAIDALQPSLSDAVVVVFSSEFAVVKTFVSEGSFRYLLPSGVSFATLMSNYLTAVENIC